MKSKIRTSDYTIVRKEYDAAYKAGAPFKNPAWFVEEIRRIINKDKKIGKLLDIACGDGHVVSYFTDNYECYGIDISKEAINKAKKIVRGKFFTAKAEKLPFPNNMFDFVTCLGSLEHFVYMDKALNEMKRVAKKGALIIIHVPNSNYIVHKALGVETQHQINERFGDAAEWTSILSRYFYVEKILKYNTRWYLKWIPRNYSCHFTFLCRNK